MERSDYADAGYRTPTVPPATPPVIDPNADAQDAETLAHDDGDSDAPGSQPAHFLHGRDEAAPAGSDGHVPGGDRDFPGEQPDEIVPGGGDIDRPGSTPDEVAPDQGDFDQPDSAPMESPPQPDTGPIETPPPPD